jgi:hypothetical protein
VIFLIVIAIALLFIGALIETVLIMQSWKLLNNYFSLL